MAPRTRKKKSNASKLEHLSPSFRSRSEKERLQKVCQHADFPSMPGLRKSPRKTGAIGASPKPSQDKEDVPACFPKRAKKKVTFMDQVHDGGKNDEVGAQKNVHATFEVPLPAKIPTSIEEKCEGSTSKKEDVLPYVEVYLPDGRLVRQCRASLTCPKRFTFEHRRRRMIDHLSKEHGLNVAIPLQKTGRPVKDKGSEDGKILPHPNKETWQRQAVQRFGNKNRKFQQNFKVYQARQRARAELEWEEHGARAGDLDHEEYIFDYMKTKMAAFMYNKVERLERIQLRINEGYNEHVSTLSLLPLHLSLFETSKHVCVPVLSLCRVEVKGFHLGFKFLCMKLMKKSWRMVIILCHKSIQ